MTSLVPPEFALPPLSALSFVSSLKSFPGDDLGQKTGQDPDRDRDGTTWMAFATRVQRVVWGTLLDPTFNSTREELWLTSISTPFTQLPFLFLQAVLLHPVFPDSISRPLRIFLMIPALTLSAIAPFKFRFSPVHLAIGERPERRQRRTKAEYSLGRSQLPLGDLWALLRNEGSRVGASAANVFARWGAAGVADSFTIVGFLTRG